VVYTRYLWHGFLLRRNGSSWQRAVPGTPDSLANCIAQCRYDHPVGHACRKFLSAERLDFTRGCRFVAHVVVVPRADRDYDGFVRALNLLLASEPDAILVPVIEETLYVACAVQRGHLRSCRVFAPRRDIVEVSKVGSFCCGLPCRTHWSPTKSPCCFRDCTTRAHSSNASRRSAHRLCTKPVLCRSVLHGAHLCDLPDRCACFRSVLSVRRCTHRFDSFDKMKAALESLASDCLASAPQRDGEKPGQSH
jgi:hypothetical protein